MRGIVDSLCDLTGNMVRPWAEAGYLCNCYDLQKPAMVAEQFPGGGIIIHHTADVLRIREHSVASDGRPRAAVFAFPPCTDLASSGARWFAEKGLRTLIKALEVVEACREYCEDSGAPWMIENPVGRLSTCWRQPDYSFDPFEYAGYCEEDNYTKRTCLWAGNGFVMPDKKPLIDAPLFGISSPEPDNTRIWYGGPSIEDRANFRSVTPMGFARAVFEANQR